MCPAYVGMPHGIDLGLQEFQQMMVTEEVVTKNILVVNG